MSRFQDLDPFAARQAKLQAWRDFGIDPYPSEVPTFSRMAEARALGEGVACAVAGRIRALRGQGALFFSDVDDATGKLQLLFKKDGLSEELFDRIDLLETENVALRQEGHFFRHAVDAAEIAAIGHRNTQIGDVAAITVDQGPSRARRLDIALRQKCGRHDPYLALRASRRKA